jgi:membrane protein implicated in regulation of membrane protease activity
MFAEAFLGGLVVIFLIAMCAALALGLVVFWIWMLVDAIQNKGLSDGEKVGWVLAIVFFHFLGSLLYFFIGRPKRQPPLVAT